MSNSRRMRLFWLVQFILVANVFGTVPVCAQQPQKQRTIKAKSSQVNSVSNEALTITGKSLLAISATKQAVRNSTIRLDSSGAWVLFPNIRPSDVKKEYLKFFQVDGRPAELNGAC